MLKGYGVGGLVGDPAVAGVAGVVHPGREWFLCGTCRGEGPHVSLIRHSPVCQQGREQRERMRAAAAEILRDPPEWFHANRPVGGWSDSGPA